MSGSIMAAQVREGVASVKRFLRITKGHRGEVWIFSGVFCLLPFLKLRVFEVVNWFFKNFFYRSFLVCFFSKAWFALGDVGRCLWPFLRAFYAVPQWLTDLNLFLWLVSLLKKTKPKKVNLFWVRKLRD